MSIDFAPMEGTTCVARHSGTGHGRADGRSHEAEKRGLRAIAGEDA